ncbi:MAG: hypothetical protein KJ804_14575 [Proteobacteria bacterium]|nr:hypothetical protein [Pseudomonadota bacterium]MBU1059534.1 hypothetical protein [Pseudomonadota bacterium]
MVQNKKDSNLFSPASSVASRVVTCMGVDTTPPLSARRAEWKLRHLTTTTNFRIILTIFAGWLEIDLL